MLKGFSNPKESLSINKHPTSSTSEPAGGLIHDPKPLTWVCLKIRKPPKIIIELLHFTRSFCFFWKNNSLDISMLKTCKNKLYIHKNQALFFQSAKASIFLTPPFFPGKKTSNNKNSGGFRTDNVLSCGVFGQVLSRPRPQSWFLVFHKSLNKWLVGSKPTSYTNGCFQK